jgi:hypothetical protein
VKSLAEAVSTVSGVVESNTLAGIQDSLPAVVLASATMAASCATGCALI